MILYKILLHQQPEVLTVIYPEPEPEGYPGEFVDHELPAEYEYYDKMMREIPKGV